MSYNNTDGFVPQTFDELNEEVIAGVNEQFDTDYSTNTFTGSNFYKFFYTGVQLLIKIQAQISAIYSRLVDYPRYINERIIRPTCTLDGFQEGTERDLGIVTSLKPLVAGEGGSAFVCADLDPDAEDFEEKKQKLLQYEKDNLTLGLVYVGDQRGVIPAKNGQEFEYGFSLPFETEFVIDIEINQTSNRTAFVPTVQVIEQMFRDNFAKMYRLGFDFEPHNYLNADMLDFASFVKIRFSKQADIWLSGKYDASFDEKIILGAFAIAYT